MNVMNELRTYRPEVRMPKWVTAPAMVLLLGYLLYAPLVTLPYGNTQRALVMSYAIVGLGLNLFTGLTGQISLGHGAFFALGAYVSAVLAGTHGWPYLAALPVAALAGFTAGYLFGRPALRLRGLSLALVTLAVAIVIPSVIKRFEGVTNGHQGIVLDIAGAPGWSGLAQDQWVYYVSLAILAVCFVACRRLSRGRIGRSLVGVRDNENVVQTFGVRPSTLTTHVFAFSAGVAAVGGVVYTYAIQYVGPDVFGLNLTIAFLTLIVVGGLGSNFGTILGAMFVVYVPTWTEGVSQSASGVSYGAALLLCMFLLPFGLIGFLRFVVSPAVARLQRRGLPS
ncbi:branched-chain amino acid ABC transporter permease [Actinomadura welshii]